MDKDKIAQYNDAYKALWRKHQSKLYVGLLKQVKRQDAKPQFSRLDTGLLSIDEAGDSLEMVPLMQVFYNNKWNGMNLKELRNKLYRPSNEQHMHSKFSINIITGRYTLSMRGQQILRKKKERKLKNNY